MNQLYSVSSTWLQYTGSPRLAVVSRLLFLGLVEVTFGPSPNSLLFSKLNLI